MIVLGGLLLRVHKRKMSHDFHDAHFKPFSGAYAFFEHLFDRNRDTFSVIFDGPFG